MKYEFIEPSAFCTPLIKNYLFLRSTGDIYQDKFIPDGTTALVFNFTGCASCYNKGQHIALPASFFVLPREHYIELEIIPPLDSMVIIFNSTVFSKIFGITMNEMKTEPYHEIDIFNGFPITNVLKHIRENSDRIEYFESYLQANFFASNYIPDTIDHIYHEILNSAGTIPVLVLINQYAISQRTFRRIFPKRAGLSAKRLERLARLNCIWQNIRAGKKPDFQEIVFKGNYFDQAHFIRDFKELCGESPSHFFNRNLNQVKVLSGKVQI